MIANLRAGAFLIVTAGVFVAGYTRSPLAAGIMIGAHSAGCWVWDQLYSRYVRGLEAKAAKVGPLTVQLGRTTAALDAAETDAAFWKVVQAS